MERKHTYLLKVAEERKIHTVNCNIYNRRVVLSLGDNRIKYIVLSENYNSLKKTARLKHPSSNGQCHLTEHSGRLQDNLEITSLV